MRSSGHLMVVRLMLQCGSPRRVDDRTRPQPCCPIATGLSSCASGPSIRATSSGWPHNGVSKFVHPNDAMRAGRKTENLRKGQLNRHTRYRPATENLRKGQLNRHTRYGTDQPLPHETLPRSGRATRWTNTPVRIFPITQPLHTKAVNYEKAVRALHVGTAVVVLSCREGNLT